MVTLGLKRALVVCSLVATACGSTAPASSLTYWQDVAPLLNEKCLSCHQAGGIAPLRLDSYDAVKANAAAIVDATSTKRMPPYLLTHDGSCGQYRDGETLTAEQIATLASWASGARTEGQAVQLETPALPSLTGGTITTYHSPTLSPRAAGGQLAEFDEYRCFPVAAATARDGFITGYDVEPGNPALVHHVIAFVVSPGRTTATGQTNAEVMAALDAQDADRAGWPCFGLAGDGVEVSAVPVVWAPGQGVMNYPEGLGVQLRASDVLVMQVHYNLADPRVRGGSDTTTVRVRTVERVAREAVFSFWDPLLNSLSSPAPVLIPPMAASTTLSWNASLAELGLGAVPFVDLVGIMPHMHQRGRASRLDVVQPSGDQCLARVEQWDFDWQKFYFSASPTRLTPESRFRVTCDFDTTGVAEAVSPGWGTRNEMCLSVMMLALPPHP